MQKYNNKKQMSALSIILLIILVLYTISLFVPVIWGLLTSLKDKYEFRGNKFGLPEQWLFSNYSYAFYNFNVIIRTNDGFFEIFMGEMFANSLLYSIGCAITSTMIPCTVAYIVQRFPCKFSRIVYSTVIVTMVLPIIGSLPSQVQLAKFLGLHNQIYGLWIMTANFLGLYFLVFYAAFKNIPSAYSEAAEIDGASNLKIYLSVMLPLMRYTIFTIMLLRFIEFWNDYQTPLVFMPYKPTVAYGMYLFNFSTDFALDSIPMKITGAMILMLPVLGIFLIFQKRLMGNISMGGLKG